MNRAGRLTCGLIVTLCMVACGQLLGVDAGDSGDDGDDGDDGAGQAPSAEGGDANARTTRKDASVEPAGGDAAADAAVVVGHPLAGDVVFSELMVDPSAPVSDYTGEWVELTNVGTGTVQLEGCRLLADVMPNDHRIAASIVVAPGDSVVLGKVVDAATNGGVAPLDYTYGETGFAMTNTGDVLRLICEGQTIDRVEYGAAWIVSGASIELAHDRLDVRSNDGQAAWCKASTAYGDAGQLGSPGTTAQQCR